LTIAKGCANDLTNLLSAQKAPPPQYLVPTPDRATPMHRTQIPQTIGGKARRRTTRGTKDKAISADIDILSNCQNHCGGHDAHCTKVHPKHGRTCLLKTPSCLHEQGAEAQVPKSAHRAQVPMKAPYACAIKIMATHALSGLIRNGHTGHRTQLYHIRKHHRVLARCKLHATHQMKSVTKECTSWPENLQKPESRLHCLQNESKATA
jgi:hypothetical protein